LGFDDHGSIDHLTVNLNGPGSRFGGDRDALRPCDLGFTRAHGGVNRVHLLGVDA
jgi:hypothetical protein